MIQNEIDDNKMYKKYVMIKKKSALINNCHHHIIHVPFRNSLHSFIHSMYNTQTDNYYYVYCIVKKRKKLATKTHHLSHSSSFVHITHRIFQD